MQGEVGHEYSPGLAFSFKLKFKVQDSLKTCLDLGHRAVTCTYAPAIVPITHGWGCDTQGSRGGVGFGPWYLEIMVLCPQMFSGHAIHCGELGGEHPSNRHAQELAHYP